MLLREKMILEAILRSFEPLIGSTIWRANDGLTASFVIWIKHIPLAVDDLAVLCNRHADAGAALSID